MKVTEERRRRREAHVTEHHAESQREAFADPGQGAPRQWSRSELRATAPEPPRVTDQDRRRPPALPRRVPPQRLRARGPQGRKDAPHETAFRLSGHLRARPRPGHLRCDRCETGRKATSVPLAPADPPGRPVPCRPRRKRVLRADRRARPDAWPWALGPVLLGEPCQGAASGPLS